MRIAVKLAAPILCAPILVALSAAWINSSADAHEPHESTRVRSDDLTRVVEFRDGTILQVQIPDQMIPWQTVSRKGEITEQPIEFGQIARIDMVTNPVTEQVANVRKLIAELGSPNYQKRESAHERLRELGTQYRDVIAAAQDTEDSEVRWRVKEILENVAAGEDVIQNDFDRLTVADTEEVLDGDVGHWSVEASFRGQPIQLDRTTVLSIYTGTVTLDFDGEASVPEIEQILEDRPELFPPSSVRMDFDRRPGGERLVVGQDVRNAYVDIGATMTTSVPDTIVSVQAYKVRAGQSAATHVPPYTGAITINFCVPGNPRLPASVKYIGCWVSYISPEGTLLQAFDARDQLIGEVMTTVTGAEFLALKSSIPIAYCKITPIEDVDPDYAFDEFIFDPPKPLIESGDPLLYSLVLNTGERLQSANIQVEDDAVTMLDLTIGVDRLTVQKSEIAVLVPPSEAAVVRTDDQRPFVQLADSSVLRATHDDQEGLQFDRMTDNRRPMIEDLAAIWSVGAAVESIADEAAENEATVVLPNGPLRLTDVSLGTNWINSPVLSDREDVDFNFSNGPLVWFRRPAERRTQDGVLRTVDGESYVLADGSFELVGWNLDQVELTWRNESILIPMREIRALRLQLSNDQ